MIEDAAPPEEALYLIASAAHPCFHSIGFVFSTLVTFGHVFSHNLQLMQRDSAIIALKHDTSSFTDIHCFGHRSTHAIQPLHLFNSHTVLTRKSLYLNT